MILFLSDLYTQVNELCSNLSSSKPGVICTQLEMQVGQKMSKMCQYFHGQASFDCFVSIDTKVLYCSETLLTNEEQKKAGL